MTVKYKDQQKSCTFFLCFFLSLGILRGPAADRRHIGAELETKSWSLNGRGNRTSGTFDKRANWPAQMTDFDS